MKEDEFKVWVRKEYQSYGNTAEDMIAILDAFKTDVEKKLFIEYIREHYNNVFSTHDEIMVDIEARKLADDIPSDAFEVLCQLIESPKFDGDVVSKNGKAWLHYNDCAIRIANNNQFGDNAATYIGFLVYKRKMFLIAK